MSQNRQFFLPNNAEERSDHKSASVSSTTDHSTFFISRYSTHLFRIVNVTDFHLVQYICFCFQLFSAFYFIFLTQSNIVDFFLWLFDWIKRGNVKCINAVQTWLKDLSISKVADIFNYSSEDKSTWSGMWRFKTQNMHCSSSLPLSLFMLNHCDMYWVMIT